MTNEKLLDAIGKKSDAIDKQFQSIDKHFQSIDKRLDSIDSRLDHLEEFAEVTRNGVNVLIEWTEEIKINGINRVGDSPNREPTSHNTYPDFMITRNSG